MGVVFGLLVLMLYRTSKSRFSDRGSSLTDRFVFFVVLVLCSGFGLGSVLVSVASISRGWSLSLLCLCIILE